MAKAVDDRFAGATPLPERQWFALHAPLLCLVANHDEGRALLGIDPGLPPVVGVLPHALTCDLGGGQYLGEFRTHNKWAKAIRHRWADFRQFAQSLYRIEVAGRSIYRPVLWLNGELVAAATTSTFFPDETNPGTTTCTGYVQESGVHANFATITAAAGTGVQNAFSAEAYLQCDSTAGKYTDLFRGHAGFNTAALSAGATVSAATLSLYYTFTDDTIGSQSTAVVSSAPASNIALVPSDYGNFGATDFATRQAIGLITTGVYTDYPLNAAGIAHVNTTGVSNFGLRLGCDVDGVEPAWASGADAAGQSSSLGAGHDPKLAVTFTTASGSGGLTLLGVG